VLAVSFSFCSSDGCVIFLAKRKRKVAKLVLRA